MWKQVFWSITWNSFFQFNNNPWGSNKCNLNLFLGYWRSLCVCVCVYLCLFVYLFIWFFFVCFYPPVKKITKIKILSHPYLRLVSLVGKVSVLGFNSRPDQHSGSYNNWGEGAAFVITSTNGSTFASSRIRTLNRRSTLPTLYRKEVVIPMLCGLSLLLRALLIYKNICEPL